MRPPINLKWDSISTQVSILWVLNTRSRERNIYGIALHNFSISFHLQLQETFGYTAEQVAEYNDALESDKEGLMKLYKAMQMARGFENACNQQYMQGKIRGFMHLDNGQ